MSLTNFFYQFTEKLNLKNSNKNIPLANWSIYYTWKNIKSAYNNKKIKISSPIWNDQFDLPNGSHSITDIQDYIEYIIKKHETIADSPPMQTCTNKIKNRIVFKAKISYKLKLISLETMTLRESSKKMLTKIKMVKMYQN